jgi:triphosphoribosyl-dephospho-CoA synthase
MEASCVRELDQFLRADGHRRNPGTTADLIAATLAIALLVDFKSSDG